MKKHKSLFILLGGVLILMSAILAANPQLASAAEKCYFVTFFDKNNVNPTTLTIGKGDCVVWMDWKRNEDVTLSFREGAKCLKAVKKPTLFKMDEPSACLISQILKYGETVYLVFTEPGTYVYDINFKTGGTTSASIVVTER